MTYDPCDPFNQLLTETPAHLLASGGFWVKQQFYDELAAEVADLKQTSGELCEVCGWRFVVPGRGCLNCKKG
jgi:hypothetical protein